MIALDTNILVRLFVAPANDEERTQQSRSAALLGRDHGYFVPVTVSLELAWVLSGRYQFDASAVALAFERLAALTNVAIEDDATVAQAVQWHAEGLDFADALHLAKAQACSELATFDRRFVKRSKKLGLKPPVSAPKG